MKKQSKEKIMIGMSGGVDSSVSAALLKDQGYEVIGVTMQIWQENKEENGTCCSITAVDDARKVANTLDIPYYVLNFKKSFDEKVIKYFIAEYLKGRTPNPCIACNRYIKFEELLNKSLSMDIPYIATGHYAVVEKKKGRYLLKKSKSKTKDQTYVLYNLTQEQLAHTVFPLGKYDKSKVRELAKRYNLQVANKKDSQEICFVEDNNYGKFIEQNTDSDLVPGDLVNTKGEVVGKHKGIHHYTIGQRKGLGIASNKALYVIDIDIENNTVMVGQESDLQQKELIAYDLNWILVDKLEKKMRVKAKIRYGAKECLATIYPLEEGKVRVVFNKSQRAITPGQAVVFYKGDYVLGGGTIE